MAVVGRPKTMEKAQCIALSVSEEMKIHLQKQAAIMGMKEGKPISVNEAIRRALDIVYPTDKQEMLDY